MYTILYNEDREGLISEVTDLMKKGWIPTGGVFVGKTYFYQSMTKLKFGVQDELIYGNYSKTEPLQ